VYKQRDAGNKKGQFILSRMRSTIKALSHQIGTRDVSPQFHNSNFSSQLANWMLIVLLLILSERFEPMYNFLNISNLKASLFY